MFGVSMKKEIYLVDGVRTPIGKFGGSLKNIPASDLALITTKKLLERNNINPQDVDNLIMGNVLAAGDVHNPARYISVNLEMRDDCTAYTVNRLCGSGMQAIISSVMEMELGYSSLSISCGAESMSRMPYILNQSRWGNKMGHFNAIDSMTEVLSDPIEKYPAGILGENLAEKYNISRKEQDIFALRSQEKYFRALEENRFKSQIVEVELEKGKILSEDEHPRKTSLEELAKLKPAFKKDGTVTAGNSSGINDGGASILLATEDKVNKYNLKPLAKIISYADGGVNHHLMGYAPVISTNKALKRANLTLDDIGLIEINEAFASQVIACEKGLNWNREIVNVNGGAISLGHPLGMSGVRITLMLAHEMKRSNVKYGLATICIGGGMGLTLVLEKI
jgi:acetyl-CoA C-acetyltransferase